MVWFREFEDLVSLKASRMPVRHSPNRRVTVKSYPASTPAFAVVFLLALACSQPAYAYVDPGTGSVILQILLSGVAGVLVVAKVYWKRLKRIFARKDKTSDLTR